MKYFFGLIVVLYSSSLLSQEPQLRIIGEREINDSLVLQTAELMIFNNTGHSICLRVSWEFRAKILSRDTIELEPMIVNGQCPFFDLWIATEDTKMGAYDYPRYPLVLNRRTCFVAKVNLLKNKKCKDSWIEFSYINDSEID